MNYVNTKPCNCCEQPINSNNKHRTTCKECKEKYPNKMSEKGNPPFIRKQAMIDDLNKQERI